MDVFSVLFIMSSFFHLSQCFQHNLKIVLSCIYNYVRLFGIDVLCWSFVVCVQVVFVGKDLIDWGLTLFSTILQSYHGNQFTYLYVSWLSHARTSNNNLSKQLTAFPHSLIAHWWKTNDACHNDFCQTSEGMLAELGFELTTPRLTTHVATDWATGVR